MEDTICAISTPPGVGGIAVIRVSGPEALHITDKVWRGKRLSDVATHTAHLGNICNPTSGDDIDQAVATVFRGPKSYTGEDIVELSVHGSPFVQKTTIDALVQAGARLAEPGEFTRRALANGRIDLTQAEGVADLLAAQSRAAHRVALSQLRGSVSSTIADLREKLLDAASLLELELDFSEEDVEFADRSHLITLLDQARTHIASLLGTYTAGTAIRDGIPIAIAGATNAGKSSLLNAIVGEQRAIVSDIHGTTRDIIEDTLTIGDHLYRLRDTAGLRQTDDTIERLGIDLSHRAISRATITLAVLDATLPAEAHLTTLDLIRQTVTGPILYILNKADLQSNPAALATALNLPPSQTITLSTKTRAGIPDLLTAITQTTARTTPAQADVIITNARQAEALAQALDACDQTLDALRASLPGDLAAHHLRTTLHHLSALTGAIATPDLLARIFSRFCVGK